jgi:hypothetical protein
MISVRYAQVCSVCSLAEGDFESAASTIPPQGPGRDNNHAPERVNAADGCARLRP